MEQNLKNTKPETPGPRIPKNPAGQKPSLIIYVDEVKESMVNLFKDTLNTSEVADPSPAPAMLARVVAPANPGEMH